MTERRANEVKKPVIPTVLFSQKLSTQI